MIVILYYVWYLCNFGIRFMSSLYIGVSYCCWLMVALKDVISSFDGALKFLRAWCCLYAIFGWFLVFLCSC